MQECGNPNQKELYSYGHPKKRLKHWTFLPCMAMLVVLYSSNSLRSCTTVNIIPLKTNMQIQRRQVHCGLWITGPSICIWILCWKQIGAVKSASGKGRVFAGKWVQTLACLGGTSCRHLPSYHVFHFMRIFCWFMALQVCHMQLLLNGQPCVMRHTQRKNISIISGSNIKAPV